MKKLAALLMLLSFWPTLAFSQNDTGEDEANAEDQKQQEQQAQKGAEDDASEQDEDFKPTEEISEDSSVPFPVDI